MLWLLFGIFIALIMLGLDIGIAMLVAAFAAVLLKTGQAVDPVMMPISMIAYVDTYALVQVPLFILAGELMNRGGLTLRLVDWSRSLVGHFRGSLGHIAVLTNLALSGISGSAVADAVATGKLLIPAMGKEGYSAGYAGAVISAGALLGPVIPPSIAMVVYAQLANESVVKMFMSGVLPGLLLAAGFMALCTIIGRRRSYPSFPRATWTERLTSTRKAIWALLMPILILAGIRFGLFTDTEVAAAVVIFALVVGVVIYRDLRLPDMGEALVQTARSTAVVLFLLAAAGPFSWLVADSQVSQTFSEAIRALTSDPLVALLLMNLLLLLIGIIMEPLPVMIIFVPVFLPVAVAFGIDPVHFGATAVVNVMIGMLTPPVGMLLFVVSGLGRIRMTELFLEIVPFVMWAIAVLALMVFFPPITMWLPSQIR